MFSLRLASLFLLASSTLVSANPVAAPEPAPVPAVVEFDKRASISSITGIITHLKFPPKPSSVITTLENTVGTILPQIDALVVSGSAVTATAVAPLVLQLVLALNTATTSLALLKLGLRDLDLSEVERRQSIDDVAGLTAGVITDIVDTLGPLEDLGITGLAGLLSSVDTALNNVLVGLEGLLAGVLVLVSGLVVTVAGVLGSLGLGSVLGILGL
ncbi:hypothetical protein MKEN_01344100 [Mycena kentingensis (nom. inval.)]|nr:hypothetical protein MKEN_01344100 [Mycena kentingensis (nom. inval.)]